MSAEGGVKNNGKNTKLVNGNFINFYLFHVFFNISLKQTTHFD